MRTATVTINPQALTHNLLQVKKRAPNSKVLAMVKANAYGHGVAAVLGFWLLVYWPVPSLTAVYGESRSYSHYQWLAATRRR